MDLKGAYVCHSLSLSQNMFKTFLTYYGTSLVIVALFGPDES